MTSAADGTRVPPSARPARWTTVRVVYWQVYGSWRFCVERRCWWFPFWTRVDHFYEEADAVACAKRMGTVTFEV